MTISFSLHIAHLFPGLMPQWRPIDLSFFPSPLSSFFQGRSESQSARRGDHLIAAIAIDRGRREETSATLSFPLKKVRVVDF